MNTELVVVVILVVIPDVGESIFSAVAVNLPEYENLTPLTGGKAIVSVFMVAQLLLFSVLTNTRQGNAAGRAFPVLQHFAGRVMHELESAASNDRLVTKNRRHNLEYAADTAQLVAQNRRQHELPAAGMPRLLTPNKLHELEFAADTARQLIQNRRHRSVMRKSHGENLPVFKNLALPVMEHRRRRSTLDIVDDNHRSYEEQALLTSIEYDTNGCMLRTMCEIAATPKHQLDTPSLLLSQLFRNHPGEGASAVAVEEWLRYQHALSLGRMMDNPGACGHIYNKCSFSTETMRTYMHTSLALLKTTTG